MLLVCGGLPGWVTTAAEFPLAITDAGEAIEVTWHSESVTASEPYLHPEFEFQTSSNLLEWEAYGGPIPGGALARFTVPHFVSIAKETGRGFYRLTSRVTLAGAALGGLDFSQSDLRTADFSGADLTGADLSGADLSGADFAGAMVEGVRLDGAVLAGAKLREALGTPLWSVVGGDPLSTISTALPRLRYRPRPEDYRSEGQDLMPGAGSPTIVVVVPQPGTTIEQFNALLAAHEGRIVGAIPGIAGQASAMLTLKLPTTEVTIELALADLQDSGWLAKAVRDKASAPGALPREQGSTPGLDWDWSFPAGGGNWGHEILGVPQLWNFTEALQKRHGGAVPPVVVGVVEGGMVAHHEDLDFHLATPGLPAAPADYMDHGAHVSGTIAATHGNSVGIQGVSPFVSLFVEEPGAGVLTEQWQLDAVENLSFLGARVINISIGIPWGLGTNNPGTTPRFQRVMNDSGDLTAHLLSLMGAAGQTPLICVSAGNDSDSANLGRVDVDAIWASGWANAALRGLTSDIFVVESVGAPAYGTVQPTDLRRSPFSNLNGHLSAPGENILSAYFSHPYYLEDGTSMAAPHVTGLSAYLLALEPQLSNHEIAVLLLDQPLAVKDGANPMVRAWHAAMAIDEVRSGNNVLRMLLDIDDGFADGNLRVIGNAAVPGRDRAFELLIGPDFEGDFLDHPGDGRIDMADFRRWRDWLLADEVTPPLASPVHGLNGSPGHAKRDANRDGEVTAGLETLRYPRGDFNGDGIMDRRATQEVPGALKGHGPLTDLEVLVRSGLWQDPHYSAQSLPFLVDSVDFVVSAQNLFARDVEADEGQVSVYDADTRLPIVLGSPVTVTRANPVAIFTVPVGQTVYVASEPIRISQGAQMMMRSIGDFSVPTEKRGADYEVDLARLEMTTKATVEESSLETIESEPNEEENDAFIEAINGAEEAFGHEYAGARGWANDEGTFYALARTGLVPEHAIEASQSNTFTAAVHWQRSFVKLWGEADPTYEVKPLELILLGSGAPGEDLEAFAEIVVETRMGASMDWEPNFMMKAQIAGSSSGAGGSPSYRIVIEEGDLPAKSLELFDNPGNGARYTQEAYTGTIDLGDLDVGQSFEVRYTLNARAVGYVETYAAAWVGDPLNYGSGIRMEYGGFGELPRVSEFTTDAGGAHLGFRAKDRFYYLLCRRDTPEGPWVPVAMSLGLDGVQVLTDPAPLPGSDMSAYKVKNQPITQPLDTDGDGIDDVYELLRAHFLNPLDPTDANLDEDGDGFSNKAEYENGTDPEVFDAPVSSDVPRYIGKLVSVGLSGELHSADLNRDGWPDFLGLEGTVSGPALAAAMANPDGTYQELVLTPIDGLVGFGFAVGDLDQDNYPDVVVGTSGDEPQLMIYRGLGDGKFQWVANIGASHTMTRIELVDFNDDGLPDVLATSERGKRLLLFAGNGDGSLEQPIVVDFSTGSTPSDATVGWFNDDPWPDLAVSFYNRQVGVLYGSGDGSFTEPEFYEVGSSPRRVASADINGDGRDDIVIANQESGDISVLFSAAGGGFAAQQRFVTGENPRGLALVDLNQDSWLDLVVSHLGLDHHSVLLNDGQGGLLEPVPVYTSSNNGNALVADFDGDGKLDLAARAFIGQALILSGDGTGGFLSRDQIDIPRAQILEVRLLNLDGHNELLVLDRRSNELKKYPFPEPSTNKPSSTNIFAAPAAVESFVVADFNLDTRLDLAILSAEPEFSGSGENVVTFFMSQPDGTMIDVGGFDPGVAGRRLVSAQLNADAFPDLLVVVPHDDIFTPENEVQIVPFMNDGQGTFNPATPLVPAEAIYAVMAQDVDGDGVDEILISGFADGQNFVALHGWGTVTGWVERQRISTGGGAIRHWQWASLAPGAPASLLASVQPHGFTPGRVVAFDLSAGALSEPRTLLDDVSAAGVAAGDVNGDGLPDLLLAGGIVSIYLADGLGGYAEPERYWVGNGRDALILADLNQDNAPDLISWGAFAPGLSLLYQLPNP